MPSRGTLYLALLLILAGLFFMAANVANAFLRLGWGQLWPGLLVLGTLVFYLPIAIWREHRGLAGLAVPGTIMLVNALILFYNALTHDWDAWCYLWTLEPLAVGLGLYAAWLTGLRYRGLAWGGHVLVLIGALLFAVFGLVFGNVLARVVAPFVLIGLGALLLVRSLIWRPRGRVPRAPGNPGAAPG
ncbi:MAG TPA: hypothetical protein PLJ35_00770 [Anaerolineae bacterium]|nr:hypothetical protein [Anaerolineae bacterium]HOQ97335.1 hypothetical protein [Anaerolineae bacterium]HPL27768.1 hypothetical protein [Anaerolineae bacterium]HPL27769.1 hypothetical protein [Anaerolineae bacterium]